MVNYSNFKIDSIVTVFIIKSLKIKLKMKKNSIDNNFCLETVEFYTESRSS